MEKLIIDRSKWRTGGNGKYATGMGSTFLVNDQGYMCCLGFMCVEMGVEKNSCSRIGLPEDLEPIDCIKIPLLVHSVAKSNTEFACKAIEINDDNDISSHEREEQLTEHFSNHGIQVEFINEYVNGKPINP